MSDDKGTAPLYLGHPILKTFPSSMTWTLPILSHLFTITIGAQVTVDTEKMLIRIDE